MIPCAFLLTVVYKKPHHISLSISFLLGLMLICLSSCHQEKKFYADAVDDRASMPVLDTRDVQTLISDSGVTRYRIKAPVWQIYDKAKPAYWEFPEGVYLEKFASDLSVDAFLEADYGYYDQDAESWHLLGNVHALNLEGERFDTPELYWNQQDERVYSDSVITITKKTSEIHGIGFDSNSDMTKYTIRQVTGIIPIEE